METRNVTTEPPGHRRFMWLRRGWFIALLSVPLVLGGCTYTDMLWQATDPHMRVWIPASRITEDQLQQEGRAYDKVHLTKQSLRAMGIPGQEDEMDGYLAEKSRVHQLTDRVVMVVGTPVTAGIDTAIITAALPFILLLIIVGPA